MGIKIIISLCTIKVSVLFEGNEAEVGPVMYASSFTACTWFSETSPFFTTDLQEGWAFIDIEDNYLIRGERRSFRPDYYFQTSVQSILFADPPGNVSTPLVCMPSIKHCCSYRKPSRTCYIMCHFDHHKSFIKLIFFSCSLYHLENLFKSMFKRRMDTVITQLRF